MKKKLFALCLVLCLLLAGCSDWAVVLDVRFDTPTSGEVSCNAGILEATYNELGGTGEDAQAFYIGGETYIGDVQSQTFSSIEELNAIFEEEVFKDGYLVLPQPVDGDETAELGIATLTVRNCAPVYQMSGSLDGVSIEGNVLHLDLTEYSDAKTFYVGGGSPFTDADTAEWYANAVLACANGGVVRGTGGTSFAPTSPLTISALCQIVARVKGQPVGGEYWAHDAIAYCISEGFLYPNDGDITAEVYDVQVSRERAISVLARAYAPNSEPFSADIPDVNLISPLYAQDVQNAYHYDICSGIDGLGTFNPKGTLTRAELCQLLYNMQWTKAGGFAPAQVSSDVPDVREYLLDKCGVVTDAYDMAKALAKVYAETGLHPYVVLQYADLHEDWPTEEEQAAEANLLYDTYVQDNGYLILLTLGQYVDKHSIYLVWDGEGSEEAAERWADCLEDNWYKDTSFTEIFSNYESVLEVKPND